MDHFAPFVRSFVVVRLQPTDLSRDQQGAEFATSTLRPWHVHALESNTDVLKLQDQFELMEVITSAACR